MINNTNILSYFIKDIKDPTERNFYKQKNIDNIIEIVYKYKRLFMINKNFIPNHIYNYKTNIAITNALCNYKIEISKKHKVKIIFYKKDKEILTLNYNFIAYYFIYNKYLVKTFLYYLVDNINYTYIRIKYYNMHKYIYNTGYVFKYKYSHICIMNKYELHYYNRFFSIYN